MLLATEVALEEAGPVAVTIDWEEVDVVLEVVEAVGVAPDPRVESDITETVLVGDVTGPGVATKTSPFALW